MSFAELLNAPAGAAIIVCLVMLLLKVVDWRQHGRFTQEDRKLVSELASAIRGELESQRDYRREGYRAMHRVETGFNGVDRLTQVLSEHTAIIGRLIDRLDRTH